MSFGASAQSSLPEAESLTPAKQRIDLRCAPDTLLLDILASNGKMFPLKIPETSYQILHNFDMYLVLPPAIHLEKWELLIT